MKAALLIVICFVVASCQKPDLGIDSGPSPRVQAGGESQSCPNENTLANFQVNISSLEDVTRDGFASGSVSTGVYQVEPCMCRIDRFVILLGGIVPNDIHSITNSEGTAISDYQLSLNQNNQVVVTMTNMEELPSDELGFNINLVAGASVSSLEGGGLCVIENISGDDTNWIPYIPNSNLASKPIRNTDKENPQVYIPVP